MTRPVGEESRESEARYRGLLEAAPDAMVVVDQAGDIVLLNLQAEKQFGYKRDELLGQPVTNIIPEGFAERLIADDLRSAADALAQQIGTGIELSARRKDGSEFPIEIMLSPLESAEGILVTAAIRDISVRKAAENQLLQAQKLESIGRLAGGIAHDFNNMLFAIHGYAELLTQDLAKENRAGFDPDGALLSVKAISDASERAAALTGQLLAFSRQQVVAMKVVDINKAVATIEPMLNQLIGGNRGLVLKLAPEAGHIRADEGQIGQIVVNLVVNARDAMPDGGTVTIETGNVTFDERYTMEHFAVAPGQYVLLAVSDTGVGMDRETREHIFEPFFTTKEVGQGTGLGLATAYGIVHQAGGHVWLYSEPGRGSTFKLYFPSVEAEVEQPTARPVTPTLGVGTVLVAEDEPAVRGMTTQLLRRAGYEVIAVGDGIEAMAAAESAERIDVLVTDVVMPNLSGIELAEQMMDRYPMMGVVLLSGYTAETLDLERITADGATFVSKPISSNQLLEAVLQAVASRRAAADRR
jgi:PAS domain S-box-containing protein